MLALGTSLFWIALASRMQRLVSKRTEPLYANGLICEGTAAPIRAPAILLTYFWGTVMTVGTILLVILILILVGVLPAWPHSRSWGYGPTGGIGLVLLILVILLVMGVI